MEEDGVKGNEEEIEKTNRISALADTRILERVERRNLFGQEIDVDKYHYRCIKLVSSKDQEGELAGICL